MARGRGPKVAGATPAPPVDEAIEPEAREPRPERPSRRQAGAPVCPAGTEPRGGPPPEDHEFSCVRRNDDGSAVLHGPFRRWNRRGVPIVEGSYREGKKHGTFVEYYDDGTKKSEASYRDGVYDGPWRTYYPDGQVKAEGRYRDGKKHGPARFYHPNGRLAAESTYREDLRVGRSVNYAPDGTLESEGSYERGLKEGLWRERDDAGRLVERTYHAGRRTTP